MIPSKKTDPSPSLQPLYNNAPIEMPHSVKYLGITIDRRLTFQDHIDTLAPKLSRSIGEERNQDFTKGGA